MSGATRRWWCRAVSRLRTRVGRKSAGSGRGDGGADAPPSPVESGASRLEPRLRSLGGARGGTRAPTPSPAGGSRSPAASRTSRADWRGSHTRLRAARARAGGARSRGRRARGSRCARRRRAAARRCDRRSERCQRLPCSPSPQSRGLRRSRPPSGGAGCRQGTWTTGRGPRRRGPRRRAGSPRRGGSASGGASINFPPPNLDGFRGQEWMGGSHPARVGKALLIPSGGYIRFDLGGVRGESRLGKWTRRERCTLVT